MKIFNIRQGFATNSSSSHSIIKIHKNVAKSYNYITCPYCDAEDMCVTYNQLNLEVGDIAEICCDDCGKVFYANNFGSYGEEQCSND
jgi:hypothetical protein